MSIVTERLAPDPRRKLQEIQMVLRSVRAISRRCLELSVQGLLHRWVETGLAREITPWACSRCGTRERAAFRRNGSYRRHLSTLAGEIELQVPGLRCLWRAHV